MIYVIYFLMKKYSGDAQTWTLTGLICCSSSSLNNPPSVFLGEKSCNQILIPEAQTRWWELKSWRSLVCFLLFFFPLPLSVCLGVSPVFLLLLFSLSLCSLSCHPVLPLPPSGCWWCSMSGNQGNWPGAQSQGPSKSNEAIFSAARRERGGEGVEMWRDGSFGMKKGPCISLNCFKNISVHVQLFFPVSKVYEESVSAVP